MPGERLGELGYKLRLVQAQTMHLFKLLLKVCAEWENGKGRGDGLAT